MSASVTNTGCSHCGGPLFIRDGARRVVCPWCKQALLIHTPDHASRYTVPCVMQSGQVRHKIKQALSRADIPESAQLAASKERPALYYVPFYAMDARLMGRMRFKISEERKRQGYTRRVDGVVQFFDNDDNVISHEEYYKKKPVTKYDTRVRMHEVYKTCPASQLQGWGLEYVKLSTIRNKGLDLLPFGADDLHSKAIVFSVDVPRDTLRSQVEQDQGGSQFSWDVELGEQRLQVLYYPVWRLRFMDEGRGYAISVSGVSGKILDGSAPENHVRGALAMVIAGMSIGLPVSFLLKTPSAFTVLASLLLTPFGLLTMLLAMSLILTALGLAWSEFRYRGEVHFPNGLAQVVRLNFPPVTQIDRLVDLLSRLARSLLESSSEMNGKHR